MQRRWLDLFDDAVPLRDRVARAFSEDGPLSGVTASFRPRAGQTEFALAVAGAIEGKETLLAEAGTGTGKSFAYLLPALLSNSTVVISTAGKPLQDQLFQKDLPALQAALGITIPVAVLKGRANYVCPYHLERLEEEGYLPERDSFHKLRQIRRFCDISPTGDRSELPDVPEDDPLWPLVTSTRENCLGKDKCPHWGNCFVRAAREKAMASRVVIVNHHLYLSSLELKNASGGQIDGMLPQADLTVFDEAHQLPGIASDFFGSCFTTWQLEKIAEEARALGLNHARDGADWSLLMDRASKAAKDLRIAVMDLGLKEGDRRAVKSIEGFAEKLTEPFAELLKAFGAIVKALEANAGRNDELDVLGAWAQEVDAELGLWEDIIKGLAARDARAAGNKTDEAEAVADAAPDGVAADDAPGGEKKGRAATVEWIAVTATTVRFHITPLSFADEFRTLRESEGGAWVFTSATLSAAGDFRHFAASVGIDEPMGLTWESPFNYWEQSCFYLPRLPAPVNTIEHSKRVADAAWPLVEAAGGRTFFLCTSLAAVQRIAAELEVKLDEIGNRWPLLVQGQMPKAALIDEFRHHGNAILVGSMSFWEGVDVRGEALSLVVIDKIPFAPPDDPVFAARSDEIRSRGGSPFGLLSLPEAIISLKQGAGRLIRSETDRGVLMICDSRIADKGYGRTVMKSLPDFFKTRTLEKALQFFQDPHAWHDGLYTKDSAA
ncbi:ATP-dependent DNA helicase [Sutterella sp.]|uniref:ATP-dependent DNA helicase n=1 Tax=Sutterella sp. TaxID=1981025 RepID=UPI0026DF42EF|nr:ATP-dependent DNA helicase [Sutterella sp.]MDO5531350.1 ATP-dependent DNA helicase [Sutterella sp.]